MIDDANLKREFIYLLRKLIGKEVTLDVSWVMWIHHG